MEWMILPLKRCAQFNGRSGRREFWFYSLFLALCYAAAFAVIVIILETGMRDGEEFAIIGILGVVFLVNFIPGLALTARRLHDIGLPGWLTIIAVLGVLFLNLIGWIAYMIVMSLPPSRGENQYGPPIGEDAIAKIFS